MAEGSPGGREVDRLSIKVLPDTSGFATSLQRYLDRIEQRARLQVRITPDTSGFTQRLQAALAGSTRALDVTVKPVLDRPAARQIKAYLTALTERVDVPIRPVLDRTAARSVVAGLDGIFDEVRPQVRPQLDESARARISRQLAELAQDRTARLDVRADAGPIRQVSSALRAINPAAALRGLLSLRSVVAGLGTVGLPAIASLVVSIAQIGPAALVAVPGVLALGSALATLAIGGMGVGTALQAAFAPAKGGAAAATSTAKAVAAAQRQLADAREQLTRTTEDAAARTIRANRDVADAEQALADARQDAADRSAESLRTVAEAERRLTEAQARALDAQKDLQAARDDAARDLEDLADRVTSGRLDERAAVLRLADAEQDLERARLGGGPEAIERAQLAYEQAAQSLAEQRKELRRLEAEQTKAAAAGVDGAERVIDAQHAVVDAQQASADAAQSVADAQVAAGRQQVDSARDVARAERDVADARQAAAEAARDGARQIADAQQAVADAAQKAAGAGGVDAFAEAMAKLAPNARAFVNAVREIAPAWREVQQAVQQRLFAGLDTELRTTSSALLPVLRQELVATAGVLNQMAVGVASSARELATNGTLGTALAGATQGLRNLQAVPGQVVTSLTSIGAAAAPALDRVTQAIAEQAGQWTERIQQGLASGSLTRLIDQALNLAGQLFAVLGNVGRILGNVFGPAAAAGGGFLGVLEQITGALARATATPEVQQGLSDLFNSLAAVGKEAAPLVAQALQMLGPVVSALAPGFQTLVAALGQQGLQPILTALGPVLVSAAKALSSIWQAGSPLIKLFGELVAQLLPSLTPLLDGVVVIAGQLAPVVAAGAGALQQLLGPILAQLPALIGPFVEILTTLTGALLPVLTQLITELPLAELGESFGKVAAALGPLLSALASLLGKYLEVLLPLLTPIISAVGQLAGIFADKLAAVVDRIVVPALQAITSLLRGDLSGAIEFGKQALAGLGRATLAVFTELPIEIGKVFVELGKDLYNAGKKIISDLIDGIKSKAGAVKDAVTGVLQGARNLLPFSPAREGPFSGRGWSRYSGEAISGDLADGVLAGQQQVYDATYAVAATAQGNLSAISAPLGTSGSRAATAAAPGSGGVTVSIDQFHAYADQAPADIGRALYRETKARG